VILVVVVVAVAAASAAFVLISCVILIQSSVTCRVARLTGIGSLQWQIQDLPMTGGKEGEGGPWQVRGARA